MSKFEFAGPGNAGVRPVQDIRSFKMRGGAATKGKVYKIDFNGETITADSETPSVDPGDPSSVFATVRAVVDDADLRGGVYVIAAEDVADGAIGEFLIKGICNFALTGESTDWTADAPLFIEPASGGGVIGMAADLTDSGTHIPVGVSFEANDVSATTYGTIWFDGESGFPVMATVVP